MEAPDNPLVLEAIFHHLDNSFTAQTCRFVNKAWNREARKILESRITINFSTTEKIEHYCSTFKNRIEPISLKFKSFQFNTTLFSDAVDNSAFGNCRKLEETLEQFIELDGKNVSKLNLSFYMVRITNHISSLYLEYATFMHKWFLKMVYGGFQNLMDLKLQLLYFDPTLVVSKFDFNELDLFANIVKLKLPSLQKITLDVFGYGTSDATEYTEAVQDVLKDLLKSAINLRTFTFESALTSSLDEILLDTVLQHLSTNSLVSLVLPNHFGEKLLCKLIDSYAFPCLQTFKCGIDADKVQVETLNNLFSKFKRTLQFIHFNFKWMKIGKGIPMLSYAVLPPPEVVMEQLKSMSLENYAGDLQLRKMPKLDSLVCTELNDTFPGFLNEKENSALLSSTLAKLKIGNNVISCSKLPKHSSAALINSRLSQDLPPWFFQLTHLEIANVREIPVKVIFGKCKRLKCLKLENCELISDCDLSGMSSSILKVVDCSSNLMERSSRKDVQEMIAFSKTIDRQQPFIGDLADLQILELNGDGIFTDTGVLFGIVHCQKLKRVRLQSMILTWRANRILEELEDLVKVRIETELVKL